MLKMWRTYGKGEWTIRYCKWVGWQNYITRRIVARKGFIAKEICEIALETKERLIKVKEIMLKTTKITKAIRIPSTEINIREWIIARITLS